jgi:hypothetical protein
MGVWEWGRAVLLTSIPERRRLNTELSVQKSNPKFMQSENHEVKDFVMMNID